MKYTGGKNGGGMYQRIICQMPPHALYVEPFLGSGAILRLKRPAERSIGIDLDAGVVGSLAAVVPHCTRLLTGCGIEWLEEARDCRRATDSTLIYCDPPYLSTATPQRYAHKLDEAGHRRLLTVLRRLPCHVLISGYHHPLYAEMLSGAGWRVIEFPAWTRGGWFATEVLWANYPEPVELHDYRFLGQDHRERLDIRRQQMRWRRKLAGMPRLKRQALLSVLAELGPGSDGESAVAVLGGGVAVSARA